MRETFRRVMLGNSTTSTGIVRRSETPRRSSAQQVREEFRTARIFPYECEPDMLGGIGRVGAGDELEGKPASIMRGRNGT